MPADDFIENYWSQRSIYIQGEPGKLSWLFNLEAFHEAIEVASQSPDATRLGFGITAAVVEAIPASAVATKCDSGNTICVSAIDAGSSTLAEFAAELKTELNFPGRVAVNAYWSPPGTGFSFLHFDARNATTIQLEGRKKWRYSERASLPWPTQNGRVDDSGTIEWHRPPSQWEREIKLPMDVPMNEVVLEPGDVLCLPAGTLHEAEAFGERSLSLNFNFNFAGFPHPAARTGV